jgi:hypothetical protein
MTERAKAGWLSLGRGEAGVPVGLMSLFVILGLDPRIER